MTRFWWDDSDGKKKICWVAWDKMTKPKAMGGLGIRDIKLFNQALLAKVAWRIVTAPNSLLARILKGKYCHRKSFLEVTDSQSISHVWRSILSGRDLLVKHLGKSIGNGQTTKLWKDPWISLDKKLIPTGPIQEKHLDLTVADLLTSDMKWNKKRIEELLPDFTSQIMCIQPSRKGAEDSFIWNASNSGVYSTKSGYFVASTPAGEASSISSNSIQWIKDVWAVNTSPKMKTFLWSILQDALPLGKNLLIRGGITDGNCNRCQERETAIHCFFTCPFAAKVWQSVPLHRAVHIAADNTLPEILTLFRAQICLPPTGIVYSVLPWILWVIWTSRNTLLFEGRAISPEETATKGIRLAQEWSQSQGLNKKDGQLPALPPPKAIGTRNDALSTPSLTCKVDAAWNSEAKAAGFGWIFEGPLLNTPIYGSSTQDFIGSPLVVEALAVRTALGVATSLDISSLRVFSDNSTLVRAICSDQQSKEIIGIVHDIRSISSVIASVSFSFLPRSENSSADRLAKRTLQAHLLL